VRAEVSVSRTVLDAIGNTPVIELRNIVPSGSARILAKLESANPTGSMKDRMARAVIEAAESDGRLPPGGTVVEYTAGTTGISLALACAAKGHPLEIVSSDAFSDEKRVTMEAFGACITDVKSDEKRITDHDAVAAYAPLGDEIWDQTNGHIDAFVHAVSTAHSIHGVTQALWKRNPRIEETAVEPAESAVLSGNPTGSYKIEGIGIGFIPPLWDASLVNRIEAVGTEDAKAMARRLAREEGIFAGTSTGANVAAALRVADRLGAGATVVTIVVDSGLRYVSTDVYRP
jgi:cysteine synthase